MYDDSWSWISWRFPEGSISDVAGGTTSRCISWMLNTSAQGTGMGTMPKVPIRSLRLETGILGKKSTACVCMVNLSFPWARLLSDKWNDSRVPEIWGASGNYLSEQTHWGKKKIEGVGVIRGSRRRGIKDNLYPPSQIPLLTPKSEHVCCLFRFIQYLARISTLSTTQPWVFLGKTGAPPDCVCGFPFLESPKHWRPKFDRSQRISPLSLTNTPKEFGAISQNNFKKLAS